MSWRATFSHLAILVVEKDVRNEAHWLKSDSRVQGDDKG